MNQLELLRYVIDALETRGVDYMLVGSFASAAYGEPRLTHDIDIVVQLTSEQAGDLCLAFPEPNFFVQASAVQEAVNTRGQFNVIHPPSGNKIDFMLSPDNAWGHGQLARRIRTRLLEQITKIRAGTVPLQPCSRNNVSCS